MGLVWCRVCTVAVLRWRGRLVADRPAFIRFANAVIGPTEVVFLQPEHKASAVFTPSPPSSLRAAFKLCDALMVMAQLCRWSLAALPAFALAVPNSPSEPQIQAFERPVPTAEPQSLTGTTSRRAWSPPCGCRRTSRRRTSRRPCSPWQFLGLLLWFCEEHVAMEPPSARQSFTCIAGIRGDSDFL